MSGAGCIGVELAEAFRRHDKNAVLIDVMPSSLSNYYDKPFTRLMDENLKTHGIKLEYNQTERNKRSKQGASYR